jgi:hypothetical protein
MIVYITNRWRPGGHAWVVLTQRAQNEMFSGRTSGRMRPLVHTRLAIQPSMRLRAKIAHPS